MDLKTKKRISHSVHQKLLDGSFITSETNFVCEECVKIIHANTENVTPNMTVQNDSEVDSYDSENEDLVLKCYDLGKELSSSVRKDILQFRSTASETKSITKLTEYKPLKWLNERPQELVHFLCNLCDTDVNTANDKKLNIISKIVELVYYCRNFKLVLPQNFTENLMCYALTNCKT